MIVSFTQSGGIAGFIQECVLSTRDASLPDEEALQLERLVARSGILEETNAHETRKGFDLLSYRISVIDDAEVVHEVFFDSITLPQKYRPLVDFLAKHCRYT